MKTFERFLLVTKQELEEVQRRARETAQAAEIEPGVWLMEATFDGAGWDWLQERLPYTILPPLGADALVLARSTAGREVLARIGGVAALEEGDDVQQALRKLRAARGLSLKQLPIDKSF